MRIVADTNTVVSGLFWYGAPRELLEVARTRSHTFYTSAPLLAELDDVLRRPKFVERLESAGVKAEELVIGYAVLATFVRPAPIEPVVLADPDDDAVLACAAAATANVIVSGDQHLLALRAYRGIPIVTAAELLRQLASKPPSPKT